MYDEEKIYKVTGRIIYKLSSTLDNSDTKKILAVARRSIGKPASQLVELMAYIYPFLPENYITDFTKLGFKEKAIISTVQLYSVHQQSEPNSVNLKYEKEEEYRNRNLGYSLSKLRDPKGDNQAVDRRFSRFISSQNYEDLIYNLRHLIKLAKKEQIKIDYPKLSEDLFFYQLGYEEDIKISWMKQYYEPLHL